MAECCAAKLCIRVTRYGNSIRKRLKAFLKLEAKSVQFVMMVREIKWPHLSRKNRGGSLVCWY